jgi:hypothetical protein
VAVTRGTLQIARRLRRDIGVEVDTVVRDLTAAWVRVWDGQASLWAGAAADLVAEAGRLDHWPRPTDIARLPRVIEALDRVETTLTGLAEYTARQTVPAAGRLVDLDVEREPALIASQAPAVERAALLAHVGGRLAVAEQQDRDTVRLTVLSRIRTDAVEVIRRRVAGQITSDLLPLSGEALDAIRRELIRGVDVGDNPRTAAARMLTAVEGRFNGGLTRALTIARTEMLDAYRVTSQQIHTANSDVVPAWQWLAELDSRVCISCVVMHGQQFPAATPGPDDHVQGRCARIPVLAPWAELGITAPEPPSVMPDAQAWFDGLSKAQQLRIAGPGRLVLLRSGRVRWSDLSTVRLNPGWRPSRVPTPVRDLRRLAADPTRPPPAAPAVRVDPVVAARQHIRTVVADDITGQARTTVLAELDAQAAVAPGTALWLAGVHGHGDFGPGEDGDGSLGYVFMSGPTRGHMHLHPQLLSGELAGSHQAAVASGFMVDTGRAALPGTIAHEYGHHVASLFRGDQLLMGELFPVLERELGISIDRTGPGGSVFHLDLAATLQFNQLRSLVSTYGASSGDELLAEIWAEYSSLGLAARPHIRVIGEKMRELAERAAA